MTDLESEVEQAFQRWGNEIGNIENDFIHISAYITAAINDGGNTAINAFITAAIVPAAIVLQQLELRLQNDAQLMEERIVNYIAKYKKYLKYESDSKQNLDKLLPFDRI